MQYCPILYRRYSTRNAYSGIVLWVRTWGAYSEWVLEFVLGVRTRDAYSECVMALRALNAQAAKRSQNARPQNKQMAEKHVYACVSLSCQQLSNNDAVLRLFVPSLCHLALASH